MQFFKSFSSFPNDIKKSSKFKSCTGSSLTLWLWRATGTSTEVFRWQSVLTCTHVGRAWERQPCFEENWTNFLKKLVLTLNSTYHLRYSSSIFFFFFTYIYPNYKVKALLSSKSVKMHFLESFCSFSNETDKKEQIQIFYRLIINSLTQASRWQQQWGL